MEHVGEVERESNAEVAGSEHSRIRLLAIQGWPSACRPRATAGDFLRSPMFFTSRALVAGIVFEPLREPGRIARSYANTAEQLGLGTFASLKVSRIDSHLVVTER